MKGRVYMKKSFEINGRSFEKTIEDLEKFMYETESTELFNVLMSARDFMEWLQEESERNEL